MAWIPKELVDRAKQVDALTWLLANEPYEIVKKSEGYYESRKHDSLKLDRGRWCWWSRGIGGRSAVDYLIKVKDYSFTEAVQRVLETLDNINTVTTDTDVNTCISGCRDLEDGNKPDSGTGFLIPKADINDHIAIRYLLKRKIAEKVIGDFIKRGVLYQEKEHKNIVFIGKDYEGNIRLASMRGTKGSFRHTVTGSDRRYPFMSLADASCNKMLHVFEAPIDLLSYATLMYNAGLRYDDTDMISLCGVYKARKNVSDSTLPMALREYLNAFPMTENILLHLDNDATGVSAAEAVTAVAGDVNVINSPPPLPAKDVNEHLMKGGTLWQIS